VPTTENLCVEIYNLLRPRLGGGQGSAQLEKVRLEETSSNSFEYSGAAENRAAATREKR
jgi:hypothetical protein